MDLIYQETAGGRIRVATLDRLVDQAGEEPENLRKAMIACLKQDSWPEPLVRNFPLLTVDEQARLLRSHVAVVGLGGLGGQVFSLLARAGVGNMVLADGDDFSPVNLNRQALCFTENLGENKARAAAWQGRLMNPALTVTAWDTALSEENGEDILCGADLAIDGLDSIRTRKTLCQAAANLGVPLVHGAVSGWSGHATTFMPGEPPFLDSVYPGEASEAPAPAVAAPAVSLIAGIQAREAIRILCGQPPSLHGRMLHFDGEDLMTRIVVL